MADQISWRPPAPTREKTNRYPALAAAAALHAALLAAALGTLSKPPKPIALGESVPVSIVTQGPSLRAAVAARKAAPAASPEAEAAPEPSRAPPSPAPSPQPPAPHKRPPPPKPKAAVEPVPPAPAPKPVPLPKPAIQPKAVAEPTPAPRPPAPLPSTPKPSAARRPVQPAPAPVKANPSHALNLDALASSLPRTQRRRADLDLNALASSLPASKARRADLDLDSLASSLGAGRRADAKGAPHAAADRTAHAASGAPATGLSADEKGALRRKLIRLWNLNCAIPGADAVVVKVRMRVGAGGALAEAPTLVSASGEGSADVTQAAVTRAVSAVSRGAPYLEIAPEHLKAMNDFVFTFDAKTACRG